MPRTHYTTRYSFLARACRDGDVDKVEKLISVVSTFLKARGLPVGKSSGEEDSLELTRSLGEQAKDQGVELILPEDLRPDRLEERFAARWNQELEAEKATGRKASGTM